MDAILDDIMGGDESGHVKEESPVNTMAIEHLAVNPRFEGGPHVKTTNIPEVPLTSDRRQPSTSVKSYAWSETFARSSKRLGRRFREYGFCSKLYQLRFVRLLVKRLYNTCLVPEPHPTRWASSENDDHTLKQSQKQPNTMKKSCSHAFLPSTCS